LKLLWILHFYEANEAEDSILSYFGVVLLLVDRGRLERKGVISGDLLSLTCPSLIGLGF